MFSKTDERNYLPVVEYTNSCWLVHCYLLDIMLTDTNGLLIGRPYLISVIDIYSRCYMGFHLSLKPPKARTVLQGLHHAILPKYYDFQYNLSHDWITYGIPQALYTDRSNIMMQYYFQEKIHKLEISLIHYQLSFWQLNLYGINQNKFLVFIKDYFNSIENKAHKNCLKLDMVEKLLVRYIVDNYNQEIINSLSGITRQDKWQTGLKSAPQIIQKDKLEI
ncbi:hypothetical protein H6G93_02260 [Nostoc sp. FACHB-973]|nr:hypothetical protein [Nostoc sp. FACHB-973]